MRVKERSSSEDREEHKNKERKGKDTVPNKGWDTGARK